MEYDQRPNYESSTPVIINIEAWPRGMSGSLISSIL